MLSQQRGLLATVKGRTYVSKTIERTHINLNKKCPSFAASYVFLPEKGSCQQKLLTPTKKPAP